MSSPGSSLFPVKHCWVRKTNMATVSRLRRGLSFNAFPSRSFSRMGSTHGLHKAKIAIFKLFWKYLIVKKCLFLWMICVVWTSLYLMRVGASWLLGELFLKSTIRYHAFAMDYAIFWNKQEVMPSLQYRTSLEVSRQTASALFLSEVQLNFY